MKADFSIPFVTQDLFQSSIMIISDTDLPADMKLYLMAKIAVELSEGFELDKRNRLKIDMDDSTPSSTPEN